MAQFEWIDERMEENDQTNERDGTPESERERERMILINVK